MSVLLALQDLENHFLRCLNLLEVPDEGEIIIEGERHSGKKEDIDKYREM